MLSRSRHHDTQRVGASPHPPLDSTSLVASPHAGASPRPPQHSGSQIRLQNRCQDEELCCPRFQVFQQRQGPHPPDSSISCTTRAHSSTIKPANQAVVCAVFRRCTAPELPSEAEQPAAVRCRPSLPTVLLLRASSSDAVPHRTGSCQATLAATVRCKQPESTPMRRPLIAGISWPPP